MSDKPLLIARVDQIAEIARDEELTAKLAGTYWDSSSTRHTGP